MVKSNKKSNGKLSSVCPNFRFLQKNTQTSNPCVIALRQTDIQSVCPCFMVNVCSILFSLKIFKSLILQTLWFSNLCDFTRYLVFWLYFGCMCAKETDVDKLNNPVWINIAFAFLPVYQ